VNWIGTPVRYCWRFNLESESLFETGVGGVAYIVSEFIIINMLMPVKSNSFTNQIAAGDQLLLPLSVVSSAIDH
jgi:hypothetical protein